MRIRRTRPERWLPIPGYEGLYEVSSFARVRGYRVNAFQRRSIPRVLRQHAVKGMYWQVTLYGEGGARSWYVHQLVARAFLGECPEGQEVRHLNGNGFANRPYNLAYGTHLQNIQDKIRHGTQNKGTTHYRTVLSEEDVRAIRRDWSRGATLSDLSCEYGIGTSAIHKIVQKKRWAHVD